MTTAAPSTPHKSGKHSASSSGSAAGRGRQAESDRRVSLEEVVAGLLQEGLAPQEEAQRLLEGRRYAKTEVHPLVLVASEKWRIPEGDGPQAGKPLSIEFLCEWFARRCGLAYVHIDPLRINFSNVTEVMSSAYAERFRILPVSLAGKEVTVATAEPYMREWEAEISHIMQLTITRVFANPLDISRYIAEFYTLAKSVKRALQQGASRSAVSDFEQLVDIGAGNRQYDANDQHIVNIVDWLWQYAFEQRASDIHIEPRRELGVVRFRIDGVLHQVYQIPAGVAAAMTSRIKILGRMDVVEKRRPQDGRIKTRTAGGTEVELRLSTLPTAFGEKLVMRIFDPEVVVKDFVELGFSSEDKQRWTEMTSRPNGIVLVTGPTGSGKTTTLYSTLKTLAVPEVNVCTIEDPIEMIEPSFNQMQVQTSIDLSFAEGVRALMRQDPDIIMVGEIRDLETAEMAIQAALTGHLVLSTLHTNDAASAMTRLLDLGVPPYLLSATILGVMAQRLVRTLCKACRQKTPYGEQPADDQIPWEELVRPWTSRRPSHIYKPVGCLECRMTGFRGRSGIYEVMLLSQEIKKLITGDGDISKVRRQAYKEGMKSLRISGAMKVAAGQTTVEEVVQVTPPVTDVDL
jgi:general secretion pathway protein E